MERSESGQYQLEVRHKNPVKRNTIKISNSTIKDSLVLDEEVDRQYEDARILWNYLCGVLKSQHSIGCVRHSQHVWSGVRESE